LSAKRGTSIRQGGCIREGSGEGRTRNWHRGRDGHSGGRGRFRGSNTGVENARGRTALLVGFGDDGSTTVVSTKFALTTHFTTTYTASLRTTHSVVGVGDTVGRAGTTDSGHREA